MTQRGENSIILKSQYHAGMMELADMRDLGSRAAMRWGSSPHARTSTSGQSPFGFVSGNSLRLLPKTALTSLPLLPNPKHLASDLFFLLRTSYRLRRRFFVPNKRHRALTPLLLLSKLNPLRWASIWVFYFWGKVRSASFPATARGYCRKLRLLPCSSSQIRSPLASDLFFRFFSLIWRRISSQ